MLDQGICKPLTVVGLVLYTWSEKAMETVWWLSPSQFNHITRQISSSEHTRLPTIHSWKHNLFDPWSWTVVSSNFCSWGTPLTTTTPFGLFEFSRMPFGLCNAAQSFQRFIHNLTRDLDFVFVYIDDIFVMSESEEDHKKHLRILFELMDSTNFFSGWLLDMK